jgi:hypothetical protein
MSGLGVGRQNRIDSVLFGIANIEGIFGIMTLDANKND